MGREHLQRLDVSWGHEPLRLTEARSGPRVCDPQPARFMGSPLSFFACIGTMNHPLTRPPGTLSPSEGERDGVRGRFMESLLSLLRMDLDHEPAAQPIPLLQDHPLPHWGRGMV